MNDWWNALSMILKVLYCIAVPVTLIFLIQTVMAIFAGIGASADLDVSDTSGLDMHIPGADGLDVHIDAPGGIDFDHSGAFDLDHSGAFDVDQSGAFDVDHGGAFDVDHSGAFDVDQSGAFDADHSGAFDADHSGAFDADQSGAFDVDHSGAFDADHSGAIDAAHAQAHSSHTFENANSQPDAGSFTIQSLFSVQGIMAFLTVFSWVSIVFLSAGWTPWLGMLIGFVLGVGVMFIVAKFIRASRKWQENGTINIFNAIGKTGTVYLPIPAGGREEGKVTLLLQDRLTTCDAVFLGNKTLSTGSKVKIVNIRPGALVVEEDDSDD